MKTLIKRDRVYLDYNATTPLLEEVYEAMLPWLREKFGNPSSSHREGQEAKEALFNCRKKIAQFLGTRTEEIIFTSGCTESIGLALRGALLAGAQKNKIVISAVEHPAVFSLMKLLEKENVQFTILPVERDGSLNLEQLEKSLDSSVGILSLLWANNETGVLFPIEQISRIAKAKGILFHVDGAQVVGKIKIHLAELGVDLFSFSAHKCYGPKGIGVLYVRKGLPLAPLIPGHQERNKRGGTENVAGIVGMAKACELAESKIMRQSGRIQKLRDWMEQTIEQELPGIVIVAKNNSRIWNTSNIIFSGTDSEELLNYLDQKGIAVSTGSACMSGSQEPSHVLLAMGFDRKEAASALRISLGIETTQEEIEFFLQALFSFFSVAAFSNGSEVKKEQPSMLL